MSSVEAEATFFSQGDAPSAYMVSAVIVRPYLDLGWWAGWDSNPHPSKCTPQQQINV